MYEFKKEERFCELKKVFLQNFTGFLPQISTKVLKNEGFEVTINSI